MLVTVDNFRLNITQELKDTLMENSPKKINKPVMSRKKDSRNTFVAIQETDDEGIGKTVPAVINTHPFVYFDAAGNYYFNVFDTTVVEFEGKPIEVITTNPEIKVKKDSPKYGRGEFSHNHPIKGSELWDNGYTEKRQHSERVCRGIQSTKIVKMLTRDEVLSIDLKPTGENLIAKISGASDAEKSVMAEQLTGLNPAILEALKNPAIMEALLAMRPAASTPPSKK